MKLLTALTILSCCIGVFTLKQLNEQREKLQRYAKECFHEAGVDLKQFTPTKAADVTARSKAVQCLARCIFEKFGIFDKAGHFQEEVARGVMNMGNDKIKVDHAIGQCKTLRGAAPCETAHLVYECFKKYI